MLSIIIPTLNEEKYLPRLLESIKRQDFSDYEIIIADAGSKDRTLEIVREYGCRITEGGRLARGRNEGAKVAHGESLLFLDADVFLPENFLIKILNEFRQRNLDLASFILDPGKGLLRLLCNLYYNWPTSVFGGVFPRGATVILIKKEIHEKIGGFHEEITLGEDYWYIRKTAKIAQFGFIRSAKIFISARRFQRDGWFKTCLKYIFCELHMIFLGPVKSGIFKYRFNHYNK